MTPNGTHVLSDSFWQGRRVLITGHTGFKGSWLALWLQSRGADVTGYSLAPPTRPSLFELAQVAQGLHSVEADVRDLERLRAVFAEREPEVVLHLAAQSLVLESYREPIDTYTTNVIGTAHVLEAVRHTASVRVIVAVTSDKCYENREWIWGYRESDALGGHDPYSSSKGCAELVIAAYARSYFDADVPRRCMVASARAGNVIGGGDYSPDRLVPDAMRAFLSGQPVVIRRPSSVRPWQHVLEPLSGYLRLAEQLWHDETAAGAWNFGPRLEDARSVAQVVDYLVESWGEHAAWTDASSGHPHEADSLRLDCSKAQALLGWQPRLALETALDWTMDWFRASAAGADMRAFTLSQIEQYQART